MAERWRNYSIPIQHSRFPTFMAAHSRRPDRISRWLLAAGSIAGLVGEHPSRAGGESRPRVKCLLTSN